MIDVVAAVLIEKDKILIARKKPEKSLGGYWEFPGGKIEKGEEPPESLVRELKEEMDIDIAVKSYITDSIYDYGNIQVRLIGYTAEILSGEIKLVDHDEYEWVTLEEVAKYKLAPADIPLVEKLKVINMRE